MANYDLKSGDYIEINFIRGTQIAVFGSYGKPATDGTRAVSVRRWLDSKGQFGANDVKITENAIVGKASDGDPRVKRAKAYRALAQEQTWK